MQKIQHIKARFLWHFMTNLQRENCNLQPKLKNASHVLGLSSKFRKFHMMQFNLQQNAFFAWLASDVAFIKTLFMGHDWMQLLGCIEP